MTQHMTQPTKTGDLPPELRSKQDERRSKPRLQCKGIAEVILLDIGIRRTGTVLDLSVNGCCIETSTPMPPIESPAVEVVFTVNSVTLRLAGVVRNVRKNHRAGIEFIGVTERKAEQIEELVRELFQRERQGKNGPHLAEGAA